MASDYGDDDAGGRPWRRMIQQRQEHLEQLLDGYSRKAVYVEQTAEMKRELAAGIVNLHRMLAKYQDESVLDPEDIPDISPIRQRLGRTAEVVGETKRRGGGEVYETAPAVDQLSFQYLEQVASQTEAAAKKLGFWANATDRPDTSEFDQQDIVTLLATRGQGDSLDDAPEDITDRVIDTLNEVGADGE